MFQLSDVPLSGTGLVPLHDSRLNMEAVPERRVEGAGWCRENFWFLKQVLEARVVGIEHTRGRIWVVVASIFVRRKSS